MPSSEGVSGAYLFVGNHEHTLDPKRRLTIPSDWREKVGNPPSVYVLPDVKQRCLSVYPAGEMGRKLEGLRKHHVFDEQARRFARVLGFNSELLAWDTAGRIRIKDTLLNQAGLKDRVILVGALDRFELWSPERLESGAELGLEHLPEVSHIVQF